jgi:methylmalonic aciduria homocystinuria type C protein
MLSWLRAKPDPAAVKDPVDPFAVEAIQSALSACAGATKHDIFWASDMSPERLVDMNRASMVSALCYFSSEMFLSIHPKFGSWVAFRAVIVLDMPAAPLGPPPSHLPPLLTPEEEMATRAAFAEACSASADLGMDGMPPEVAAKWAAMRDCVSLGREYKCVGPGSHHCHHCHPPNPNAAPTYGTRAARDR